MQSSGIKVLPSFVKINREILPNIYSVTHSNTHFLFSEVSPGHQVVAHHKYETVWTFADVTLATSVSWNKPQSK
jgi:hypothetical protein